MSDNWYDNPDTEQITSDAGRRAYIKTFYAAADGRKCLCHIEAIVMAMPEDTDSDCRAKLKMIGLVNTIKGLAGVDDRLKIVEAEGRVARGLKADGSKDPKSEKYDMYKEFNKNG
jgi:hypothetical protein